MTDKIKKLSNSHWLTTVQENTEDKELFIQFPEEAMNQMGWHEGDMLEWIDNKDGSWSIQKK